MGDVEQRIAALSPEQRELLLRRLREKATPGAPAEAQEIPRIPPGADRHQPVRLTPIQEAYWIGSSGAFDLGGCGANVYIEYELTGSIWTLGAALDTAVRRLIERHEILRTVVLPDGTQRALPTVSPFEVQVADLSARSQDRIERILAGVREEMRHALRPVDVWPLFEILAHQLPAGKIRIHARFDGVLIDGLGRNRIIEELTRLIADPEAVLPPLEVSFLDHARALAKFRDSATYRQSREYWMERLPSLPPWPVLPLVREVGPATVPRMARREQALLPAEIWRRLLQRAARLRLTPTGILTAAFAELVRRDNPEPSFTLAVEAMYRPPIHPQIRDVVGNFATITLLGVEGALDQPFEERAQRLQRRLTEDLEHLHFSGHEVLRELNRRRLVGSHTLVPILFDSVVELSHSSYHGEDSPTVPDPSAALPPVAVEMVPIDVRISLPQVLLLCVVQQVPDGSLRMITQEVQEVLPEGLVPDLVAGYAGLLERLALEEALWVEKDLFPRRPKSPGRAAAPGTGAAKRPAPPSRTAASWSPAEAELAGLWEEVLGRRPETSTDDFFALGGDSLLAARLLARVRERFHPATPLHDFLLEPTLAGMAGAIQRGLIRPEVRASLWSRLTAGLQPGKKRLEASSQPAPAASLSEREDPTTRRSAAHGMRIFLTIWLGQLVSAFGTGLGSFALGVWIYEKTGSATQFAMIGFVVGVTILLVSPVAGTLADLWDRRKLLILSDLGSGLITFLMASLLLTGLLEPWHVYPIVAAMIAFSALQGPALTSSISLLVPREQLARASGMTQMSRSVAQILGPLTAGALVGRIGYHGVIYIDAVSFLFALGTVLLVRIPSPPGANPAGRRSLFRDFTYGWSYLRSRGGLLALMGLFAITNFSMGMVQTLLTPLILSFATPVELGTVNSAGAAGVLLGSLALALWGGPSRRTLAIFGILLTQGALLFLGGAQPSVPLIAVATLLFMITIPIINACNQVILQRKVAPDVQGRVFAMAGIIASFTVPLAALTSGPLADRVFEPALAPGGALADSVGRLIGVGPGRGVGLLFVTLGVFVILVVCLAFLNPRLRRVETELPDAVDGPRPVPPEAPGLQNA